MNAVIGQVLNRHAAINSALHAGALIGRHTARRKPVLDVLTLDRAADGCGHLGGAAVEHGEHGIEGFCGCHEASSAANLFATVSAKIVACKPGKLTCMKSLGEQVQEFMESEGVNAPAMAKLVGKSRQNIENLVAGTVKNPSYLAELARVMRTTVDVLLAGRYVYRDAGAQGQVAPSKPNAPSGEPWPLDPFITRDQWRQLAPAQQSAVAWEASKALREMGRLTAPAPAPVEVSLPRKSA